MESRSRRDHTGSLRSKETEKLRDISPSPEIEAFCSEPQRRGAETAKWTKFSRCGGSLDRYLASLAALIERQRGWDSLKW